MCAFEILRKKFPKYEQGWAILDQIRQGDTIYPISLIYLSDDDKMEAFKTLVIMAQKNLTTCGYRLINPDGTFQPEIYDEPDQIPDEKLKNSFDITSEIRLHYELS